MTAKTTRPRDEDFDVEKIRKSDDDKEERNAYERKTFPIVLIILLGVLIALCSVLIYNAAKNNQKTVVNTVVTTK